MGKESEKGIIIGIDLGTTNCCVAVWQGDRPVIIPNADGENALPSVVAEASDGRRLIGRLAVRQAMTNPRYTVFGAKRLLGRAVKSPHVVSQRDLSPFEIVGGERGDARIKLRTEVVPPPAIAAELLGALKRRAEIFLGEPVLRAVITVPAYFSDSQRSATRSAGHIAGLDVVRMINEPTAAALAFGHPDRNARVLVFDLGGGTFDVSILELADGVFKVLGTGGDTRLGGEDFDDRLVTYTLRTIRENHGVDLGPDPTAMQRLREALRQARHELSEAHEAKISLPFLSALEDGSPIHLDTILERGNFEHQIEDLVGRAMQITQETLATAKLDFSDLDDVLLVGGATRTPLVRKRLRVLSGVDPSDRVDPDEAVALGAAVQAAALGGLAKNVLLLDVTPHDLGIELPGNRFEAIVKRNEAIPVSAKRTLTNSREKQSSMRLVVRQGRSDKAEDNELLGVFGIDGFKKGPRGSVRMALDFAIDADGVVHLTARNDQTGHAVVGSMRAPSGMTTDEIKHYAELFRTRWLVEVERDGETSAKKELGKVVAKLREQAGGCTDEIEAGRLTRIIEHASELLDSGNGTEVHRMLSWLRSRFGRPAADRSRGDEPAAQVDRSP